MTLNDILEEHSIKAISSKTRISEENLENLVTDDFSKLAKAKTLGFISIIEREYKADLKTVKTNAMAYYDTHVNKGESINIALPRAVEQKTSKKWLVVVVLALLALVSGYFYTQFDKSTLDGVIPFGQDKVEKESKNVKRVKPIVSDNVKGLSLEEALNSTEVDESGAQMDIVEADLEPTRARKLSSTIEAPATALVQENTQQNVVAKEHTTINIVPDKKLWFGIIDMDTGKRDHFSVYERYIVDVKNKNWLIATSTASFSVVFGDEIQEFNDAREHYFKMDKQGVTSLSKKEYVSEGGYSRW